MAKYWIYKNGHSGRGYKSYAGKKMTRQKGGGRVIADIGWPKMGGVVWEILTFVDKGGEDLDTSFLADIISEQPLKFLQTVKF